MLSQRTANLVFVVFIVGGAAYFAWVAEGFVTSGLLASQGLPSKFFPQLTLALTGLCAVIVGVQCLSGRDESEEGNGTVFEDGAEARRGLLMLCVAVACYAIWRSYGFVPMAILLGPMSLLAMGVWSPVIYLIVWALTAAITAIFIYGLGIQLV